MQRKFLSWLFLLICAAFTVAGGLAFLQFQRQAEARAQAVMSSRLHDLMLLISYTQETMQHMEQINDEGTLERVRAAAEIVRLNPGILRDQEALQGICNSLGATQLCITDAQGIVEAGVPASMAGLDLTKNDQNRPLLKCITTPGYELVLRPRNRTVGSTPIQYSAVSRLDAPGVIRLGFTPLHEASVRTSIGFEKLAAKIIEGTKGQHVVAFQDGELLNPGDLNLPTSTLLGLPLNKVGEAMLSGESYATYALEENGMRLVMLIPWREITKISFKSLRYLLLSNIGLFVLVFIVVWILLRVCVLRGLRRINTSLQRITEGYTEERVIVRDTPEFTRLSTGINAMVDSLQAYSEQKSEHIARELHLAAAIQRTVQPSTFPAFPQHTEFDIYATGSQSREIGGDFYDFFMPDSKHLCFLLGDVADTGIPAALFMMRAITIIHSQAQAGTPPQQLLTNVNKELCADASGMRLSLFYGRLNITTGDLRFVNAGTPQALHRVAGGEYEMLSMKSGAVLGTHAGASYTECRLTLQPGDRIFLYSNGVIVAQDAEHNDFGLLRLQETLKAPADSVTDVPLQVRTALQRHTGSLEQRADITMLALEFRGKWQGVAEVSSAADSPQTALDTLEEKLQSILAAPNDISDLKATISAIYAAMPPDTVVDMLLQCNAQEAQITLQYNKPQFNPLISLPHLPLDKASYSTDKTTGSTLKLHKTLQ